jgi:sulfite exporter TauE/SafE/copper chaperone CopZ
MQQEEYAAMKKKEILHVDGMTCVNCENKIEKQLAKTVGVMSVKASFTDAIVEVIYDSEKINLGDIRKIIEEQGYTPADKEQKVEKGSLFETVVILIGAYFVLNQLGFFRLFYLFPTAKEGMGYGMLFLIGLLTSVHCIAMCGGINLSQCMPVSKYKREGHDVWDYLQPAMMYNLGRVLSYTIVGGVVGALGSVISFSGSSKGIVQIAAGIFMVIMGLSMLQIFPELRRFVPRMPAVIAKKIYHQKEASNRPFYVGLLNGLMPCGPLQAMQLYALSTGSPIKGALAMFLFSLGTVPLMFVFGAVSRMLSQKFAHKVMTAGAVLVVILGVSMLNNGVSLSGFSMQSLLGGQSVASEQSGESNAQTNESEAKVTDGVQNVTTSLASGQYEPIKVKAGVPVKWTITAEQGTINGCNGTMVIPEYGIQKTLQTGDNVIEFTPTESGTFTYSCWMGMIRSTITVTK